MMRLRPLFCAVFLALGVACTADKLAPAAGGGGGQGGSGSGVPGGGTTGASDGGADAGTGLDGSAAAGFCPPSGRYQRTQRGLGPTSDPRCELSSDPQTRVFLGPVTQQHPLTVDERSCTLQPDELSDEGCSLRRVLPCDDGTTFETRCQVSAETGAVSCVQTSTAIDMPCTVLTEYVRDLAWKGPCDAMGGPYTRSAEITAGGPDCPELASDEISDPMQLALDPMCTFVLPDADGSCDVEAYEACEEAGVGATHKCKVSRDASRVTCKIERADCVYEVELVR